MATTLKAIRREMLTRMSGLGEQHAITSLGVGTVVCNSLLYGTMSAQKYIGRWLVRGDAASAVDRVRACSNFTASTGTLAHAGTNYSDTTATGEVLEVLEFEPRLYDLAIQAALLRLHRLDREILPTTGEERYPLGIFDWITEPADVVQVSLSASPVISRNRYFRKLNSVNTSGAFVFDNWAISGSGATVARSTTQTWRGNKYSAALARSGTDGVLSQSVGLLEDGVSADSLRGQVVTVVGRVWSAAATTVRLRITDGVDTSNTSYHTGGSSWEELSVAHTVNAAATSLTISVRIETDTTVYLGEAYLCVGTLTDAVRRDVYQENELRRPDQWGWDQGNGELTLMLPATGRGRHYIVSSDRAYPGFDSARLVAGSADADETDAPKEIVATGAIGLLLRGQAEETGTDGTRFRALSEVWLNDFAQLAARHLGRPQRGGVDFQLSALAQPARRF